MIFPNFLGTRTNFSEADDFYERLRQIAADSRAPDRRELSCLAQENIGFVLQDRDKCRPLFKRVRDLADFRPEFRKAYQIWSDLMDSNVTVIDRLNRGADVFLVFKDLKLNQIVEFLCKHADSLTTFNASIESWSHNIHIDGLLFQLFSTCKNIKSISIVYSDYSPRYMYLNEALEALFELQGLESLKLECFESSQNFVPKSPLFALKSLEFNRFKLRYIGFSKFPSLESLKLTFGTYGSLKGIEACQRLTKLDISSFEDESLHLIGSLTSLEELDLSFIREHFDLSSWLLRLVNLRSLNLSCSSIVTTGSLESLTKLTEVKTKNTPYLSLASIRNVASHFKICVADYINNHKLNIANIPDVKVYSLPQLKHFLFELGEGLTYLDLYYIFGENWSDHISDIDIQEICMHCPNLKYVKLKCTDGCTSEILTTLGRLRFLEELELVSGKMETVSLINGFYSIKHLTIRNCSSLKSVETREGIKSIPTGNLFYSKVM